MPPRVKYQKDEIIDAALRVTRRQGFQTITAREIAAELGASTRPIFTWFDTMEQLKAEVCRQARDIYRRYIEQGLAGPIPFLGVWQQYIRFAREERELYKLLFLTKPGVSSGGAMEAMRISGEMARESVMHDYNMDAETADRYFRDVWLVAFSFATLIVTEDCPYTDEEIFAIGAEISLSICKAYKEIPGLSEGNYDRDRFFSELVRQKHPGGART